MKRRFFTLALKFGLIPALVAAALFAGSFGERSKPAEAGPIHVVAFNEAHCITLGVAFGGVPGVVGLFNCVGFGNQPQFQTYIACLLKAKHNDDPLDDPLGNLTPDVEICPNIPLEVIRPETNVMAGVDLDGNKAHAGQFYEIIAFVDDEFPVRFTTDRGRFAGPLGETAGADLECGLVPSAEWGSVDPDCDQNPATIGDGVVVARFTLDPADGDEGVVNINVVQESIGFPIQLTVTGPPDEITLEPLFGKDTIQTGATSATPSCELGPITPDNPCEEADDTDCNAELSVAGVLGAGSKPEQTIIVAKALDHNGEEVSGAVLVWDVVDPDGDNTRSAVFDPPINDPSTPNRLRRGGVQAGLRIVPTLDTGALGVGFPQFVCAGRDPGPLTFQVKFDDGTTSSVDFHIYADKGERERITLNVIPGAEEIQLAAVPPTIDCDGVTTSTVTATILNGDGDPVANGVDVHFSVLTLGTANPLKVDSADGVASTVVTPLSGAGDLVGDGQPKGVTVGVELVGEDDRTLASSILVACTGGPPPPGQADAGAGGAGGTPSGAIRPPDTGTGGQAASGLTWWPLAAIGVAAGALGVAGGLSRRLN